MKSCVKFFVLSHIGNSRDTQEDNFLLDQCGVLPIDLREEMKLLRTPYIKSFSRDTTNFMAAVCDGMGGHASGEVASALSVRYLCENYQRIIDGAYLNEQFLINEIAALNRAVVSYSKTDGELKGMGATLCGVICTKGFYYGFNVGDSRLYRYSDNHIEQLSTDHTEGQRLLKLNLLSEEEYERFPRRKNLYKYVGTNSELIADVFKIGSCVSGSTLLLCSDGLSDVINENEMAETLSKNEPLECKGRALVQKALGRNVGHGDNITLILIEF